MKVWVKNFILKKSHFIRLAAVTLLVGMPTARADVQLFSDLSTVGDLYQKPAYAMSNDPGFLAHPFIGFAFTASATSLLDRIDVALTQVRGSDLTLLALDTGNDAGPTGDLILWDVANFPSFQQCCTLLTTVTFAEGSCFTPALGPCPSPITLIAGQEYWLRIALLNGPSVVGWRLNNTGAAGLFWTGPSNPVLSNTTLGAFDVIGTGTVAAVPEPSAVLLLATAIGCEGFTRWRRRARRAQRRSVILMR